MDKNIISKKNGSIFKKLFSSLQRDLAARNAAASEIVQQWQRLFAGFAGAEDPVPEFIIAKLSRASGIAADNLRAGIRTMFSGLQHVLRQPQTWRLPAARQAPRIAIVAAGNVPGVAIAPSVLLAAAGCPVIVKQARQDCWLLSWLLETGREQQPEMAAGIHAGYWPARSAELAELLKGAEVILAYGSGATIQILQQTYPGKVLGFGHKFSVALVAPAMFSTGVAEALALDVVLFDQSGCLSAQAVFVLGRQADALEIGQGLLQSLQQAIARLGSREGTTAGKMRLHAALDSLDLLGTPYFLGQNKSCCVAIPAAFDPDLLIGQNFVQVVAVPSLAALLASLRPYARHLQGIALAVSQKEVSRFTRKLEEIGFSYVCLPGQLQAPPLDWPNAGVRLPEAVFEFPRMN